MDNRLDTIANRQPPALALSVPLAGGGGEGGTERRGRGPSNVTAQLDTAKMLWVFHSVVGGRFVVVSASVKDRRAGVVVVAFVVQ